MDRRETRIEDGVIALETNDGWLRIGTTEDVIALAGGRTYEIGYDDADLYDWLDTDDDGILRFDVVETIASMTHPPEFVESIGDAPLDKTDHAEYPERTVVFVDVLTEIWEQKGNVEDVTRTDGTF